MPIYDPYWNQGQTEAPSEAQSSRLTAALAQQKVNDGEKEEKIHTRLQLAFAGAQSADDPSAYENAARLISPLDPSLGMKYSDKARQIKQSKLVMEKEQLGIEKEKQASRLSILGLADAESYKDAMAQFTKAGGQIPSWYSGDFEKDKGKLTQLVFSGLSPLQQIERRERDVDLNIRQEDFIERQNEHKRHAEQATQAEHRRQQREDFNEQFKSEQAVEKDRAVAQRNSLKTSVSDKDLLIPLQIAKTMPAFKALSTDEQHTRLVEVVSRAKQRLMEAPELNYADAVEEELQKIGSPSSKGTEKAKKTPSQSDIAYVKAHPEVADQFKEHYGFLPE